VGKLNASTILLEPLDRAASAQLLDQLDEGLDADLQTRLIATSDGNPLFLEEMVALARDQGSVVVPPTIQVLLSARLESLPTDERDLLERGSIEGEVFHRRAVCALAEHHPAAVERRLAELVRKDLIRPHPVNLRDDDAFRFRHLLIRDAAYDGLTMAARTKLHERFATWLEDTGPHLPELDEIAGWHLEQTVRYQRDLGRRPDDAVATRATRHLLLAGRRAAERFDTSAAVNLLRRAHGLAFADEPLAATAGVELAEQLVAMGDFAAADELLEAAEQTPLVATRAELIRLQWLVHARPEEATAAALGSLPDLIERLTLAGDDRGLVKAHLAMVTPHWVAGRATAAVSEARRAVDHATAAGDEQLRARAQGQYITLIMFDRTPASVIARELDAIERDRPGLLLTVLIRQMRGWLCRLAGEFDEARRIWELSRQGLEAMGRQLHAASYLEMLADIEVAAGDHAAALAALSRADTLLQAAGDRSFRSTIQAYLAEAHERLGDRAAAEAAVELAEQMSAPDDAVNFALTHGVRARLALAADDLEAAERWARSALERALTTEFPLDQARQRINLADVMQEIDRRDVAESETRLALELFELKEDRPGAAAARARLARLRR
jgi:tetratricopeptide (TPR) repeat protein